MGVRGRDVRDMRVSDMCVRDRGVRDGSVRDGSVRDAVPDCCAWVRKVLECRAGCRDPQERRVQS